MSELDAREARDAGFRDVAVWPLVPSRRRLSAEPRGRRLARLRGEPGPHVLTVGRLAPNKRIEVMLAAHFLVTRVLPNARFHVVGSDGGTEGYALALRRLARELGVPNVVFHGPVDDRDLAALYRTADLFVLASAHEGCGLPILEAMHHRVPVVARATTGIVETAGGGAVLLDTDEPERWACSILDLLLDRDKRTDLVEAGARRAAARLALDIRQWLRDLAPK